MRERAMLKTTLAALALLAAAPAAAQDAAHAEAHVTDYRFSFEGPFRPVT